MPKATVGERFQVVIPKRVRQQIGLRPHDKVTVEVSNGAVVIRPVSGRSWRGIGRELGSGADATDYVKKLRSEWASQQ